MELLIYGWDSLMKSLFIVLRSLQMREHLTTIHCEILIILIKPFEDLCDLLE